MSRKKPEQEQSEPKQESLKWDDLTEDQQHDVMTKAKIAVDLSGKYEGATIKKIDAAIQKEVDRILADPKTPETLMNPETLRENKQLDAMVSAWLAN